VLGALLSALHVLAFGIGLGSVVARGRALRAVAGGDLAAVSRVLAADNFWGLAAFLWLSTGLLRAFGGIEKSAAFYLYNGFFWVKMALFAGILLLEMRPMVTFITWRAARARGREVDLEKVGLLLRLNRAEIALVVLIPFAAAAMARGLWLFP
jgi:putative membrane protein